MFLLLKSSILYYLKRKCEIYKIYHLINHGNTGHFRKLFPLFFVINFLFHYILLHQNSICHLITRFIFNSSFLIMLKELLNSYLKISSIFYALDIIFIADNILALYIRYINMCILYENIFIITFILYFNNFYIQNVFYLTIDIIYTFISFLTLSIKNQHSVFNIFADFIYQKFHFFHKSITKTKYGNIFRTQASP